MFIKTLHTFSPDLKRILTIVEYALENAIARATICESRRMFAVQSKFTERNHKPAAKRFIFVFTLEHQVEAFWFIIAKCLRTSYEPYPNSTWNLDYPGATQWATSRLLKKTISK